MWFFVLFFLVGCVDNHNAKNKFQVERKQSRYNFVKIQGVNSDKLRSFLADCTDVSSDITISVEYFVEVMPLFLPAVSSGNIKMENAQNILIRLKISSGETVINSVISYQRNDVNHKWETDDALYSLISKRIILMCNALEQKYK